MILNIHGLYGCHENNNYHQLRSLFPQEELYSPQIDYLAEEPRALLDKLAARGPYDLVVGNSLGGFFAYALSSSWGWRTVLTNPCVPAHEYLPELAEGYRYLDELQAIWEHTYPSDFDCSVIVGTRDEIIDHEKTLRLMRPYHRVLIIDSEHRMQGSEYVDSFRSACCPADSGTA